MIELTDAERQAVKDGQTICIQPAEIGKRVVLLLEDQYEKLLQDGDYYRRLQEGWQNLAYGGLALSSDNDEP